VGFVKVFSLGSSEQIKTLKMEFVGFIHQQTHPPHVDAHELSINLIEKYIK
jgi:hypothetical protein